MADWRQIQARIRKAKNASDAHAKLSELYQRTHDAMVAWELALLEEKALVQAEAVKWYTIAAERFRRSEWKKKAEEALTRLGAPLPAPSGAAIAGDSGASTGDSEQGRLPLAMGEISEAVEAAQPSEPHTQAPESGAADAGDGGKKKRRRGRRGGRGRRRKGAASGPALPAHAFAESAVHPQPARPQSPPSAQFERHPSVFTPSAASAPGFERPEHPHPVYAEPPALVLPSERTAHGRAGDPALASRMSHLESLLRRLVASPLRRLDEADEAPAGPGVFLLSDSDQITSYYIEACQTLRIGMGNLARGGRAGKSARGGARSYSDGGLKAKLAEHLGISEAKVSQYLKDHCVVRWIQLDDEAPLLAHFAIGVLRTPLNLE